MELNPTTKFIKDFVQAQQKEIVLFSGSLNPNIVDKNEQSIWVASSTKFRYDEFKVLGFRVLESGRWQVYLSTYGGLLRISSWKIIWGSNLERVDSSIVDSHHQWNLPLLREILIAKKIRFAIAMPLPRVVVFDRLRRWVVIIGSN